MHEEKQLKIDNLKKQRKGNKGKFILKNEQRKKDKVKII